MLNIPHIDFPSVDLADEDGLLAIGGILHPSIILSAYKLGIFPWYNEDEPILWWSPNPRFVLYPDKLKISKSMRPYLNGNKYRFTVNRNFGAVIQQCGMVPRKDQDGTWITDDIINCYTQLHQQGNALSAEAWEEGQLVGGLYGVKIGKIFFGESMFSLKPNASKFAFIQLVQQLKKEGVVLIDCQIYSEHLESMGAEMMSRPQFCNILQLNC
ncbi:MAG: leucyl/phenylalanyl-tRNA--protein transferase [Ferruginibacter sp.]